MTEKEKRKIAVSAAEAAQKFLSLSAEELLLIDGRAIDDKQDFPYEICCRREKETIFRKSYNTGGICTGANIYSCELIKKLCSECSADYIGIVMYSDGTFEVLFSKHGCYSGNALICSTDKNIVIEKYRVTDI